jgi:hypothetical protein
VARKRNYEGSSSTDHLRWLSVRFKLQSIYDLDSAANLHSIDMLTRTAMYGTRFLEETGWKNPSEPHDGIFQYANHTKLSLFDYLATQPTLFADFNLFMGATSGSQSYWWDWYDIQDRLLDGYDKKKADAVLVDVGGGKGHDLQAFYERFGANGQGDLVLQDTPRVIAGIQDGSLDEKIKRMGHDFFEPQPVNGELPNAIQLIPSPTNYRRENVFLTPYPSRLVRQVLSPDPQTPTLCHDTRLLQTNHPRSCLARCGSISNASEFRLGNDVNQLRHRTECA